MIIKLHFNSSREDWIMITEKGHFMQEFKDCVNFNLQFPYADKTKLNIYNLPIAEKIGEEERKDDGT